MTQTSLNLRKLIQGQLTLAIEKIHATNPKLSEFLSRLSVDKPADMTKGNYSTSVALSAPKTLGVSPVESAIGIVAELNNIKTNGHESFDEVFAGAVEKIEVAGPGFINFYLKPDILETEINSVAQQTDYGKIDINIGKKIAYEYTDPNPFKVFHIGHLVDNAIGESLSRLGEYTGGDIRRFCYQGDLGRHVAFFIYGLRFMDKGFPSAEEGEKMTLVERAYYMGTSYAKGATYFKEHSEKDPSIEQEVQLINKKLYERSDEEINAIYDLGLEWSLQYLETLYDLLGTKFDQYFFESKCVEPAKKLIAEALKKGIFTESEGAIVFEGEKFQDAEKGESLHTRVFITKFGLPTYDAKELGLAELKYAAFPYDKGFITSGNEQDQYFKVNLKAQSLVLPELVGKITHLSHGMMKLPTGKMSSRTGDVVSAEEFIESARNAVLETMKDREIPADEKNKIANQIAIAGIKYLILRQAPGKDIIYDAKKALSFDGDSGPYLQYTCVRARAILNKAKEQGIIPTGFSLAVHDAETVGNMTEITNKIFVFPEIIERAYLENSPHHIATYAIELAGTFNAFYANNQIVDTKDDASKVRSASLVTLTNAVANTLASALHVLGIEVPVKM